MITNGIKYYRKAHVYRNCKIFYKILFCMPSFPMMNCGTNFLNSLYMKIQIRQRIASNTDAYMRTLPDHPGASWKCSPTPALLGVRQNLQDVKIQKNSRPSFLHICMVITVTCCWKAIELLARLVYTSH